MKNKQNKILRSFPVSIIGYIILFAFFYFLMYRSPLISDDFEFANLKYTSFSELFNYALHYGNGRVLGNVGAVFFVNYPIINAIIKSAIICALVYLLPKTIKNGNSADSYCACLLVLGISSAIFGQVYSWTSGFMNYVPPVVIMLFCLHAVRYSLNRSRIIDLLLALVGFVGQLFVEHVTVVNILIAGLLIFIYIKEKETRRTRAIIWFVSGILGAMVMFLVPKIFYISNNRVAGYRNIHLTNIVYSSIESIHLIIHTMSQCLILFAVFTILGLSLAKERTKGRYLRYIIYTVYPIIQTAFLFVDSEAGILRILRYLLVYFGMVLYVLILLYDICTLVDRKERAEMLVLLLFAVISVAPFLIIRPFGERCIFLSYIFLCMFALRGMAYLRSKNKLPNPRRTVVVMIALILILSVFLGREFSLIKKYDDMRHEYIRNAVQAGEPEVTVFELPSKYSFVTYLLDKYYYREHPGDIKFVVVDYDTWCEEVGGQ